MGAGLKAGGVGAGLGMGAVQRAAAGHGAGHGAGEGRRESAQVMRQAAEAAVGAAIAARPAGRGLVHATWSALLTQAMGAAKAIGPPLLWHRPWGRRRHGGGGCSRCRTSGRDGGLCVRAHRFEKGGSRLKQARCRQEGRHKRGLVKRPSVREQTDYLGPDPLGGPPKATGTSIFGFRAYQVVHVLSMFAQFEATCSCHTCRPLVGFERTSAKVAHGTSEHRGVLGGASARPDGVVEGVAESGVKSGPLSWHKSSL